MRELIVAEFITLDGVIQAPGGVDEDTEGRSVAVANGRYVHALSTKRIVWHHPRWHYDYGYF